MNRTLLVMRHAQAANPPGVLDFDRPLTDHGVAQAGAQGAVLAGAGLLPDAVLCSSARRAADTAGQVLTGAGSQVRPKALQELYSIGVARLIAVLAHCDPDSSRVLLVGHQPVMSALVAALTGEQVRCPTATICVVRHEGDWAELDPGTGTLAEQFFAAGA